ncbi:MAG: nitrous oxide-stimulated promoter family protein [Paramuribaculum sp.]|nr:nitrous oxide-stimulated promoter family protein [Paramuribaculum sp.]
MDRIEREKLIVEKMIRVYCRAHHNVSKGVLCQECEELCRYSHKRLENCPFGNEKSSCRKCKIHCYQPKFKTEIAKVMRYTGPRMIFIDPVSAFRHLWSEMIN